MSSLVDIHLKCNNRLKINFNDGNLSSDTGLFLIKESVHGIGFDKFIKNIFKTNDSATDRYHKDDKNLY